MNTNVTSKSYIWETIKAIVVAIIISLLLLLIAAFAMGALSIEDKYMDIINQCIKGISIFVACIFCLKLPHNRWLRGFIVGVFYVLLAFFIFSAMAGEISFGLSLLNDIAIGAVSGLISGVIAKLIRKDRI